MRVLVADDSVVFRNQIREALTGVAGLEVVDVARNGNVALDRLRNANIDLMTLDLEMPELDGFGTLRAMKEEGLKCKVIVFTSHGGNGPEAALRALQLGALDFVVKPHAKSPEEALKKIQEELLPKVLQFKQRSIPIAPQKAVVTTKPFVNAELTQFLAKRWAAIVIASSTGGPPALEALFRGLVFRGDRPPIVIAQHMPPGFTARMAERLTAISGIRCVEAETGQPLEQGSMYIAPGDFHLTIKVKDQRAVLHLDQRDKRNSVRPAADYLFETAADVFGKKLLGLVLTGMGEDGAAGAAEIKTRGGMVAIQNKETSVVWGMPGATFSRGACDGVYDLTQLRSLVDAALA